MEENTSNPTHLEPSKLGTKEYWDAVYATELTNHAANPAEEGTVWFSDSDAEAKILEFLDEAADSSGLSSPPVPADATDSAEARARLTLDRQSTSFLDLGCGNGSLLFALRDDDWAGHLLGVDYSEASVALARQIASEDEPKLESELAGGDVAFAVWDVLAGPFETINPLDGREGAGVGAWAGWDVVLDKGTFDAVSLSDERDGAGRRICEGYRSRVLRLLRPGGIFLLTSCNWTEAELRGWFEGAEEPSTAAFGGGGGGARFEQAGRIEYPSFSFGGAKGQTISTVCFVKRC